MTIVCDKLFHCEKLCEERQKHVLAGKEAEKSSLCPFCRTFMCVKRAEKRKRGCCQMMIMSFDRKSRKKLIAKALLLVKLFPVTETNMHSAAAGKVK